jgi:hypothetical protein
MFVDDPQGAVLPEPDEINPESSGGKSLNFDFLHQAKQRKIEKRISHNHICTRASIDNSQQMAKIK